jgi:very-short-patch-repair endonuclease
MKKDSSLIVDPASSSPLVEGCPQGGVSKKYEAKNIIINGIILKPTPITELPYNPNLKVRAKDLRKARNLPEVLFWMQVTKSRFHAIDFDRQRVIGNYIVDFYIKQFGLVIEIDGSSHDNKKEYDDVREEYLISLGLKVYRIKVIEVMKYLDKVKSRLEEYLIENYRAIK